MAIRSLAVFVVVFVVVSGVVFLVAAVVQGVPLIWLLGRGKQLSVAAGRFVVTVSPEAPSMNGETITVTVRDARTLEPVEGVSVAIWKDRAHLVDFPTDARGIVQFEYPGETTILVISKGIDYQSEMKVLPREPASWFQDLTNALFVGIVSGVISDLFVAWIKRRILEL